MSGPFHAYDIRGVIDSEVTEELAYKVGRAYCRLFSPSVVVVGHDMRESSAPLAEALISGLRLGGGAVSFMGLASTDMMYLAVIEHGFDAGFMVTASHNPAQYNGIKIVGPHAVPLGLGTGLERIEEVVGSMPKFPTVPFQAALTPMHFLGEYVSSLLSMVDLSRIVAHDMVVDAGNGMGGLVMPPLLDALPVRSKNLFFDLDGSFPNHEANPLIAENRIDLERETAQGDFRFGLGLDGDCDRAFFVDEQGRFANGDFMVGLLAERALGDSPGAPITFCVRSSRFTSERIVALGGVPHMVRVGHAYAKMSMRALGAPFGGEVSGHYYFRRGEAWFDSGPLTFLWLLELLSRRESTLAELLEPTRNYFISGEINSTVADPDAVMTRIEKYYASQPRRITIDGLRIETDDWWFNVRRSNTEPLFRLNCEGRTEADMVRIRDEVLGLIRG